MNKENKIYFRLLQIAVFFTFLGRAWQHWFYEAPYREVLWDEQRMSALIKAIFGMEWNEWVSSPSVDAAITSFIDGMGIFYLGCAIAVLFVKKYPRITAFVIKTGAIALIVLAVLYWKQKLYATGQFFEYTLAFMSPFFLLWISKEGKMTERLVLWMKVAIAITFCSHALYAAGHYPQPLSFFEMTANILNITEEQTVIVLLIAAILDIVMSILIFLPYRKIVLIALLYGVIWGFLTAIARPWGYFHIEYWSESLHRWGFEAMFRLVHGIVPLVLFIFYYKKQIIKPVTK